MTDNELPGFFTACFLTVAVLGCSSGGPATRATASPALATAIPKTVVDSGDLQGLLNLLVAAHRKCEFSASLASRGQPAADCLHGLRILSVQAESSETVFVGAVQIREPRNVFQFVFTHESGAWRVGPTYVIDYN